MASISLNFGKMKAPKSTDVTATSSEVLKGYTAITLDSNDSPIEGKIPSIGAETYEPSSSDRSIQAGSYLAGAQTIKGVTISNISAGNIKSGVTITVGDSDNPGRLANVAGTYSNVSSGQKACTADSIRAGYSGFANGSGEIKGSIANVAAATFNTATSDRTINAKQFISGTQTIKAVTTSNVAAGNFKKGIAVKVGDGNSATRIANITGSYTTVSSGQSAVVASVLRSGYSGFANGGGEIVGTMSDLGAQTITPGTSNKTIPGGRYTTGVQTIAGDANLVAANIANGIKIFNVTGNAKILRRYNGSITPAAAQNFYKTDNTTTSFRSLTCTAHGFTPVFMMAYQEANVQSYVGYGSIWAKSTASAESAHYKLTTAPAYFTSSKICVPVNKSTAYTVRIAGY